MKQSRQTSLLKSVISTAVGFFISFALQATVLPWMLGAPVPLHANLSFAALMTAVSIGRGYLLERWFERMGWRVRMSPFATAVLVERQRQKDVEGWDEAHDDAHEDGELAIAAAAYALADHHVTISRSGQRIRIWGHTLWQWGNDSWKAQDRRRNYVKSAALMLAEGERFDRNRKRR